MGQLYCFIREADSEGVLRQPALSDRVAPQTRSCEFHAKPKQLGEDLSSHEHQQRLSVFHYRTRS